MRNLSRSKNRNDRKIRIETPAVQTLEEQKRWQEVRKYSRLIPSEPEPNLGRVREIKEEIAKGTYLTSEIIEETAARLAIRFIKRE
ncbi:MAG: hypothetical protein NC930_06220 [Candidatus Omnitrophica bacterium]|nr:hypothetical protein [Candidatus Omnitrophota bacterium]